MTSVVVKPLSCCRESDSISICYISKTCNNYLHLGVGSGGLSILRLCESGASLHDASIRTHAGIPYGILCTRLAAGLPPTQKRPESLRGTPTRLINPPYLSGESLLTDKPFLCWCQSFLAATHRSPDLSHGVEPSITTEPLRTSRNQTYITLMYRIHKINATSILRHHSTLACS